MSTSARMLQLLSLLQTHRYWAGADLAERLEVSARTLRRDIERLRDLGYPVDAGRGVGGGYQLRAGAVLPPLVLDDEEAVAIAVGLATAAGGSVAGIEESSVRALSKVVKVMPSRLRGRVQALQAYTVPTVLSGPTVDAGVLTVIAQACRDDERLRFAYTPRGRQQAERTVEPHRLVSLGRRWYLVAWDLDRQDWRTFRVDRLMEPAPTGVRFRQRDRPAADAAAFVQASIAATPARYDVLVTVEAPAEAVQRVVCHWGTVEAVDQGSCRLRMRVDSLDWPAMVLGAVGAHFQVTRPPELVEHLLATGRRFVRATEPAVDLGARPPVPVLRGGTGARPGIALPEAQTARLRAAVAQRLLGYEEAAAVRRAELRQMTEEEAGRIADELLQLLPLLAGEPDRGSGLVEQQRLFRLARP